MNVHTLCRKSWLSAFTDTLQFLQKDVSPQETSAKETLQNSELSEPATLRQLPYSHAAAATCGMICIAILVQRSSDKSPAIRSKAITCLANLIAGCVSRYGKELLMQLRHVSATRKVTILVD